MKNPFFSRWDGKRISSFRSKNQRSTRMPFNSWGGKRAHGYLDDKASFLMMRGSKSFSDKDAHKNFVEYAKRLSNFGRRTPFYSWGGKRNVNTGFDINKYINTIPEEETEFYLPKGITSIIYFYYMCFIIISITNTSSNNLLMLQTMQQKIQSWMGMKNVLHK